MFFTIKKVSDWTYAKHIYVNGLAGLAELQEIYGHRLVVDFRDFTILIYDDYME